MYINQELGRQGEEFACDYLNNNNYNIIEKNFYCRYGEIDIIAIDLEKEEIVFFEVKTRRSLRYGKPVDSVTKNKLAHLKNSIKYYIFKKKFNKKFIRVDVIEVYIDKKKVKINHIKQII